jgi:hypothetical protein
MSNIHLCTIRQLPQHLWVAAHDAAVEEHPQNKVRLFLPKPQRGAMQINKKWAPGRTITAGFLDGTGIQRKRVEPYFHEWEQYANLKFRFVLDPNLCDVRISFRQDEGSWSYLGTDILAVPKSDPTMVLGWLYDDTDEEEYGRVVRHEAGHTVGFEHELQQPDAAVDWDIPKVLAYYEGPPNRWSEKDVYDQVIDKVAQPGQDFTAFDRFSIMAYSVPAAFTKNKVEVPMNTVLSDMDKAFATKSYPFPNTKIEPVPQLQLGNLLYSSVGDTHPIDLYKYDIPASGTYRIWSSYVGAMITVSPVEDQGNPVASGIQQVTSKFEAGEYRIAVFQRKSGEVANYRIISRRIG